MKKISTATATVLLAALIPLGLSGQQMPEPPAQKQEKGPPPLKAHCQAADEDFVKGQNVELRCVLLFREGVTLKLDDLKKPLDKNFTVIGFSATEPLPVPNQKDFNFVAITEVLKPSPELKYDKHSLKLSLGYSYPESKWHEKEGKKTLETKVVSKIENFPAVVFEKVPVIARIDDGEGWQDVVNIGEHIRYTLRVFYEKGAVTLLNDLTPIELDRKYAIRDATKLNSPDLKPFTVINRNDQSKKQEVDRGYHKELVYEYKLALFEISLFKMFEVPSINVYYVTSGNKPVRLTTPVLKIRTNSVLNRDSDFRPLKNIFKPDPEKFRQRGLWPTWTAYGTAALAGLIILFTLLSFLARLIKKIYQTGLREALVEIKKSAVTRINELEFVAGLNVQRTLKKLEAKPDQDNLKIFIKKLRLYMGAVARIKACLALSMTASELNENMNKIVDEPLALWLAGLKQKKIKNAETLENAEYLLDEEINPEDLKVLRSRLVELTRKSKEGGTWS